MLAVVINEAELYHTCRSGTIIEVPVKVKNMSEYLLWPEEPSLRINLKHSCKFVKLSPKALSCLNQVNLNPNQSCEFLVHLIVDPSIPLQNESKVRLQLFDKKSQQVFGDEI